MKNKLSRQELDILSTLTLRQNRLKTAIFIFLIFYKTAFAGDNKTKQAATPSNRIPSLAGPVQLLPQRAFPAAGNGYPTLSQPALPKQTFHPIIQSPNSGSITAHSTPPFSAQIANPRSNPPPTITFVSPPKFVPLNQSGGNNGAKSASNPGVLNSKPPVSAANKPIAVAKPASVPPQFVNAAVSSVSLKPGQGYCTDFANAVFVNEVAPLKNSAPASDMRLRGDASQMLQNARSDGWLTKTGDPSAATVGALITYTDPAPNMSGPGHIGVVTDLVKNAQGQPVGVKIAEMNAGGIPKNESPKQFYQDYKTTTYGEETTKTKYFDNMNRVNSNNEPTLIFQGYIYPQRESE